MVSVYMYGQIIKDNMKVTGTKVSDMPMVKKHYQMVKSMKVNITLIRRKAMVFIRTQVEIITMGSIKMTKGMELDSSNRMDKNSK